MKIGFIAAANSFHTVKWANAMAEKGHQVTVFSLANHADQKDSFRSDIVLIYLPQTGFKGYYLNVPVLKKHLKQSIFDVLDVQYASGYATLARLTKASPLVLSVLGSDVYDFPFKSVFHKKLVQKNLRYAHVLASSSRTMAQHIKTALGVKKPIAVVPFGVDTERFCPQPVSKQPGTYHIGTVKLLEPVYDIGYLLNVFARLKKKGCYASSLFLDIYGYGSCLESLKQQSRELQIDSFVTFHGYIDNSKVPDALSGLDVFCLTSTMESFGVAAVEAMACEVPVVASDAEGFKEVVDSEKCGFIVPKTNMQSFADKIDLLLQKEDLRRQFGKYGRQKVLRDYNLSQNIDDFEKLLIKTAKQKNRVVKQ